MKKRVAVVRQVLFGLVMVSVIAFGTAEAARGSGKSMNEPCSGCSYSRNPDLWCAWCCNAGGSICIPGGSGQCLCA